MIQNPDWNAEENRMKTSKILQTVTLIVLLAVSIISIVFYKGKFQMDGLIMIIGFLSLLFLIVSILYQYLKRKPYKIKKEISKKYKVAAISVFLLMMLLFILVFSLDKVLSDEWIITLGVFAIITFLVLITICVKAKKARSKTINY